MGKCNKRTFITFTIKFIIGPNYSKYSLQQKDLNCVYIAENDTFCYWIITERETNEWFWFIFMSTADISINKVGFRGFFRCHLTQNNGYCVTNWGGAKEAACFKVSALWVVSCSLIPSWFLHLNYSTEIFATDIKHILSFWLNNSLIIFSTLGLHYE